MDERVAKAVINVDETDVVLDLHKFNGKVRSSLFKPFWMRSTSLLVEDDIMVLYIILCLSMPIYAFLCLSLRHLQELVTDRLKRKYPEECPPVPSLDVFDCSFGHPINTQWEL